MANNISGDQISKNLHYLEIDSIAPTTVDIFGIKIKEDYTIILIQSLFRNYLRNKKLFETSISNSNMRFNSLATEYNFQWEFSNTRIMNFNDSKHNKLSCVNRSNSAQWNNSSIYFGSELDMTEVTPYLFLGSIYDAKNIKILREKNINFIIQLLENESECPRFPQITYYFIEIKDNGKENLFEKLNPALDFIDESHKAGGNVLVHCRAGLSRSPSIIIAYMIIKFGFNEFTALKELRKMRPGVNPNNGFKKQLKKFRKSKNIPFFRNL